MSEVVPVTRTQSLKMAGVIAGTAIGVNALFWVLAGIYYKDKAIVADPNAIRFAFAILTALVSGLAYVAGFAPRFVGHLIGFKAALASLAGGFAALGSTIPGVVAVSLLVNGIVMLVLTWRSWKHSRPAWAFLIAILAVLATVTFFGAPKMRHVLGIGLWYTLIIPALGVVGVIALSMVRSEYRDQV